MSFKDRVIEMLGGKISDKVATIVEEIPVQHFFAAFALFLLALAFLSKRAQSEPEGLNCEECGSDEPGQRRVYKGQTLCDECYDLAISEDSQAFPDPGEITPVNTPGTDEQKQEPGISAIG